ncbi:nuclear pore complex protein Nup107 [Anabrus simplex]|uniref:nuclear pore complex protein Nup107 n=1 Tax=Anabrus simplex TaxID=316456 RepID=UPI0034DD4C88
MPRPSFTVDSTMDNGQWTMTPHSSSSHISEINLNQSLRLLSDALHSPAKSTLRVTKSTPIRRTSLKRRTDPMTPDRSMTRALGDTPTKQLRGFKDLSLTLNASEFEDTTVTTTGGMFRHDPWKEASDRLFMDFLESMQSYGSEQQVFETISDFIQNCSNVLDILKSMDYKLSGTSAAESLHEWLVREHASWCLVYCLYQNRLSSRRESTAKHQERSHLYPESSAPLSEKEVVLELYRNDTVTRECQLVVDWLEQQASKQLEGQPLVQHYTDKTVAWENTLHQLQSKDRSIPYASSRPILNKLDPDAILRENKPLHDLDKEDEAKLVKAVFVEIRCGRLEEAQTLCIHCGQPWRAASLEGWRLFHDPNYKLPVTSSSEKLPVEGNPNRDLWKLVAWRLASDVRLPPYARATHAALCGHLDALDAVCHTWSDKLWAYLRVIVDIRVEEEIRACMPRSYIPMPDAYWKYKLSVEEVFTKLSASDDPSISADAANPEHLVQKYLILDQISPLMESMIEWIKSCDAQFLRFLAHLVLFFRLIGRGVSDEIGDTVLEAYVKVLMKMREPQLVAYYVAALPQEDQVLLYAQFLEDIVDNKERQLCLSIAEDVGLDVFFITKTVVENIRNREAPNEYPDFHATLTPQDLEKISALDWVTFYDTHYPEAIWQANAMIRQFIALGKVEAARKAFNKIPIDAIDIIIRQYLPANAEEHSDEMSAIQYLPQRVSNSIREYLCHRAYLDAQEGFSDWFQHFHHAKPIPPVLPAGEVTFTERVAYDHRKAQYKTDWERWKMAMQHQTKTVKAQLFNVLMFPAGGWLVDGQVTDEEIPTPDEEENQRRRLQMENLRKLCIPQVVVLLVSLMQSMGEHDQCLQLADIVVSERYKLYKVYTPQKLGELLKKLCESVHDLVCQRKDPWGFPTTDEL